MLQDFRYGFRMLLKAPGFTLAAILALGLGIGANSAIFSVIKAVLLQPLPYPDPDRLVRLYESQVPNFPTVPITPPDFRDWRERQRCFERIAAYRILNVNLTGVERPERLFASQITDGMFALLGVHPSLGRDFLPEEDEPGRNRVAILSSAFFERRFGSNGGVLGTTIELDGEPYTVVGVMPRFRYLAASIDIWVPMAIPHNEQNRFGHSIHAVGRLRPGVSIEQARREMEAIGVQIDREHPHTYGKVGPVLIPLYENFYGSMRKPLAMLWIAVGFVLLIACANVANLLLARGAFRYREISIRAAMGAGRWRLSRLVLAESLILGAAGGIAGSLFSLWAVDVLKAMKGSNIPRLSDANVDGAILAYTFLIALLTGVIFGMVPALHLSRADLHDALKDAAGRSSASRRGARLRSVLVVAETALALVLLIGAGLLLRTVNKLLSVDVGIRTERLLTMSISLPGAKYNGSSRAWNFWQDLVERVGAVPGVAGAAATSKLPLRGGNNGYVIVEGQAERPDRPVVEFSYITPGYFRTAGIPLRQGRYFTEADRKLDTVVVNETFARRMWPGKDPIGKRFTRTKAPEWLEVVGVAGDTRQWDLAQPPLPEMYQLYARNAMTLVVRSAIDPDSLVESIRREVNALDKDLPVYGVRTMERMIYDDTGQSRFYRNLLLIFAGIALLLAAVGIYGVISYSVSRRRHEIGVRMAIGARAPDVVRMVIREAAGLVLVGIVIGTAGALYLSRFAKSMLYDVKPADPVTYVSVAAFLAAVGLVAAALPAWRATRVDPAAALRHE